MLRKLLYDIEVYSPNTFPFPEKAEHPINSVTFYDNYTNIYISIIIDPSREGQKKIDGNWEIYYVKDERNLIILSVKLIKFFSPDVFAGWYNSSFDDPYYFNRCNNLEMKNILNSISPLNYVNIRGNSISGMHLTDMILLDKKIKKRTSYTLENVAIEENLPVRKLEKHEDIAEIYRTDKDRFVKYNKGDVEVLAELEKKNRIIDFFENTRTFAGLNDINEALKNSVIVDTIALRKAHREGIVLPSKPTRDEAEESEDEERSGGFVKFPTPGVHRMVAVLDMAKFYPVILGLLNLSAETVIADNLTKDQINFTDGDYYVEYEKGKYARINSKIKGFMPSLYDEFLTERLAVEAEMKKFEIVSDDYNFLMQKRQVVKDTSNSLPGVNGYGGFRLHNNVIANAITFTGQKMIKVAADRIEEQNIGVIYQDTDSCHIELPNFSPEELVKKSNELSEELSHGYIDVVKKEYNIDTKKSFEIEFEKAFKTILYISKDDGTPAKKRYGARCVVVSDDSNINIERNLHKNIKDIIIGDKILAWSEDKGIVKTEVKNIFKRETNEYLQIHLDDDTNIKVTSEHPIYVVRQGWKKASEIKEGDILLNSYIEESLPRVLEFLYNGRKVIFIKKIEEKCNVINFECEPHNNYFVNNILVHNCFYEKEKYTDYLYVRGFDMRRSDASNYCKNLQEQVLRMLLWDKPKEETIKYVQDMIFNFKKAPLEDISTPKGINKPISEYGKNNKNGKRGSIPAQIMGAIYSNTHLGTNFAAGSKIKYFFVKRMPKGYQSTRILSFDDINKIPKGVEIDYEKMIDANIKKKIERILLAAGINWNEIEFQKSLFDF